MHIDPVGFLDTFERECNMLRSLFSLLYLFLRENYYLGPFYNINFEKRELVLYFTYLKMTIP